VSKRYRVVREPFTAPLTHVEQANLNAQQNKKRRRHRVQFAGTKSASSINAASTYAVNQTVQAAQTRGALYELQSSPSYRAA